MATDKKKRELVFITVIGNDQKGIVARISAVLFKAGINIEDIIQKIFDRYFVMCMLVDVRSAGISMDRLQQKLEQETKAMGLRIQIQHENIFSMMHRI